MTKVTHQPRHRATIGATIGAAIGVLAFYPGIVFADVVPDFLRGGANPESGLGNTIEQIFEWVLYIAMGLAAIGTAYGLAQMNGLWGNKEQGWKTLITSLGILVIGGALLLIIKALVGLAQ